MQWNVDLVQKWINAFSKSLNTLSCGGSEFRFYNLLQTHKTLRMTPTMAADIETSQWSAYGWSREGKNDEG